MPPTVETPKAPPRRSRTGRTASNGNSVEVSVTRIAAPPPAAPPRPTVSLIEKLEPTRQQIRERAYLLYLGRNGAPGDPVADWLTAEQQLRAEMSAAHGIV